MRCQGCNRENETGNQFCIYCGLPFGEEDGEEHAAVEPPSTENLAAQVRALRQEVQEIRSSLVRYGIGGVRPAPDPVQDVPTAAPAAPSAPPAGVAPASSAAQTPTPRQAAAGLPASQPATAATASTSPSGGGPPRDHTRAGHEGMFSNFRIDWELIIGENWIVRVGVLAVIIGIGLFLKLAVDNDWIGPVGQFSLGIITGLAFLGGSQYWMKRYPLYAQALAGGGIGILYLSIFAAFGPLDLIGLYPAVGLLFLISVAAAGLAIRHESVSLAVIGIVGAFAAPFLTGITGSALGTQAGPTYQLLAYVIVVDIGVLALSTLRNWRWFTLLALFGSLISFGAWYGQYGDQASLLLSQGSLTIIFLIFVGATTLFHIVWKRAPQAFDQALMVINVAAYFGISYGLLWTDFSAWMGLFTLLLALFYGGLAFAAIKRSTDQVYLSFFALGIALVLLTVAIPVQIGGPWISVAWAAEGAVLIWLSYTLRMWQLRVFGVGVFAVFFAWLLILDTPAALAVRDVTPVLNDMFPVFLITSAATYIAVWLFKRHQGSGMEWENSLFPAFLVAANTLVTIAVPTQVGGPWIAVTWAAEAIILLAVGIKLGIVDLRRFGIGVFAAMAVRLVLFDGPAAYSGLAFSRLDPLTPVLNVYMLSTGLAILAVAGAAVLVRRYAHLLREHERVYLYPALAVGAGLLFAFTAFIQLNHTATVWVTITWAFEAVAVVALAHKTAARSLRFFGLGLLAVMTLFLLAVVTPISTAEFTAFLNLRMLAFVVGIAGIYGVAILMMRYGTQVPGREREYGITGLIIAANLVTLWILSAEVIAIVDSDIVAQTGRVALSIKSLSLSLVWAVYASIGLAVGIARRWRMVRLGSLGLLAVPILKLFLVDSFALDQLYRVAAFMSLGAIMLVAGFLYQRYSAAIKEFLFE